MHIDNTYMYTNVCEQCNYTFSTCAQLANVCLTVNMKQQHMTTVA
jgi:hypothetical protein